MAGTLLRLGGRGVAGALLLAAGVSALQLVCVEEGPDLAIALRNQTGAGALPCLATLAAAVQAAAAGEGVMVLSPGYPATTVDVTSPAAIKTLDAAAAKGLRLYIEFPSGVPGQASGSPPKIVETRLERAVVASTAFASAKPVPMAPLTIISPHVVNYTLLSVSKPDLVLSKVAGFDTAVYGLPTEPGRVMPLLFTLNVSSSANAAQQARITVATTRLSNFLTSRFAPIKAWATVLDYVVGAVDPSRAPVTFGGGVVTPTYQPQDPLPTDSDLQAMSRGVQWYLQGGQVPGPAVTLELAQLKAKGITAPQFLPKTAHGMGQMGVLEGYFSTVRSSDGRQPISINLRDDCGSETAMAFAMLAASSASPEEHDAAVVAKNILDFLWIHGGYVQPWMPGTIDPLGDAMGLLAWSSGTVASAAEFYKDDDARAILAGLAASALLNTDRWDTVLIGAVLGNLRITGVNGFGPGSATFASIQSSGWQSFFNQDYSGGSGVYSPHYQSYIWACYLWAYESTGYQPLYDRAQAAIRLMMTNYPTKWQPTANGITMQRARMLLPLAWLIRVNDTALHRTWLNTIATGLLARQHACGAIQEEISAPGWGGAARTPNNDNYGTFEAPLNQNNSDPVSDLLYTSNFAFLGLHEAAAATGNSTLQAAANKLAGFLTRIQAKSIKLPEFDGAFFRAFDFKKWEVWGSDADLGWGAWSIETGWTQSWISTVFGLRHLKQDLWTLTQSRVNISDDHQLWRDFYFPPEPSAPCLNDTAATPSATVTTGNPSLCAPAPGKLVSHVSYTGVQCGTDKRSILWTHMKTLDPRAGVDPTKCTWDAAGHDSGWQRLYTGSCGVSPTEAPLLPNHYC